MSRKNNNAREKRASNNNKLPGSILDRKSNSDLISNNNQQYKNQKLTEEEINTHMRGEDLIKGVIRSLMDPAQQPYNKRNRDKVNRSDKYKDSGTVYTKLSYKNKHPDLIKKMFFPDAVEGTPTYFKVSEYLDKLDADELQDND